MKICVIGAGWYGCHIALKLIEDGHEVKIFEKKNKIFSDASGNNQNRLHQGFHYPRSAETILSSRNGFKKFKDYYKFLTKTVNNNIYSISKSKQTKLNFKKYCKILKNFNLKFKKLSPEDLSKYKLKNLEGAIKCDEELILISKSIKYFEKKLKLNINYNFNVINFVRYKKKIKINNDEIFDWVIDCSGFRNNLNYIKNLTYEYCVIFLYKKQKYKNSIALTIMDGPFFTLYPWSQFNEFGLYSVQYSRLLTDNNIDSLEEKISQTINKNHLNKTKSLVEKKFKTYYPEFKKNFKFKRYLLSIRVIAENKRDDRISSIFCKNKIISVFPGKIDHIFSAYEKIKKCLKKF